MTFLNFKNRKIQRQTVKFNQKEGQVNKRCVTSIAFRSGFETPISHRLVCRFNMIFPIYKSIKKL